MFSESEIYSSIQPFLTKELNNVTKCAWFIRGEEEEKLYSKYAMHISGEGAEIETPNGFENFKMKTDSIMHEYENERFSFEEFSFYPLEFISCRYYGYLPRVRREADIETTIPSNK